MSLRDDAWRAFTEELFDQNAFAIKLGLDNIRRALSLEGNPERAADAIVVGGTNGKGSVASALAAILQLHGLRVGLFTSPHLVEFRERIRIDGAPVARDLVLDHGRDVMSKYSGDGTVRLSFFELTTVMAARVFAEAKVDVVVWEVGLGGRLDAVNAIEPALTVVTNIGLDHQAYLGDTVELIAAEKGALRREGVPFVLGPQTHRSVVSQLGDGADLVLVEGDSRQQNWATAVRAAKRYLGDALRDSTLRDAQSRWRWPGRLDWRAAQGTSFLLDAAHNPAGVDRLMPHLGEVDGVVVAAMRDKDLTGMFAGVDRPTCIVELASKRAADASEIAAALGGADVVGIGNAPDMFDRASQEWSRVAVFGSLYLLGEWFSWAQVSADELVTVAPD